MSTPTKGRKSLTMEEILENLPSPVMIVRHHTIIYGNESFWEFYLPDETQEQDISLPEQKKIDIYELVKSNSRGALRKYLLSLSSLEKPFETILISSDNEYTPVLISGRCLNPSHPAQERIYLLVCTDISAKLKNEFLLYEMLEEIDEIFFVISVEDLTIQYINRRGLMLLRMNEEDLKGKKFEEIFPEFKWPHLSSLINLSIRNMMPQHDREINARLNGLQVFFCNIIPIHDFNQTYTLMLVSLKEITKFQTKINLANQLEKIIQSIPDPMLIVDSNMEFRLINNAAIQLKGINPLYIRDGSIFTCSEVFQSFQCGTDECPLHRIIKNKETIKDEEIEILDNVGKRKTFLLSIIPLELYEDQTIFLMRFSDITKKKEYEKELTIYQKKLKEENIKLQQEITEMTITPVHETSLKKKNKSNKEDIEKKNSVITKELIQSTSYLFPDASAESSYTYFLNQVQSGKLGLIISRIHPDKIRIKYGIKETPIVWVNNSVVDEKNNYVQPNLQVLLHLLKSFLKEAAESNDQSVIFIDCLEYLTIFNDFHNIIQFYEMLVENIIIFKGIAITHISPEAFEKKEVALLKRGSIVIGKK